MPYGQNNGFILGRDYERYPGSHWWSRRKWRLLRPLVVQTSLRPAKDIHTSYISLSKDGLLREEIGYVTDGITCGFDTAKSARGWFLHDGICQLNETDKISYKDRRQGDREFRKILVYDGIVRAWARMRYWGVSVWSFIIAHESPQLKGVPA